MKARWIMGAAAAGLALAGCTTMPKEKPTAPPLPAQWSDLPTQSDAKSLIDWWKGFNDPFLNHLVDEALREGPNAQIAALRVQEARALSRATLADFAPQLNVGARANYQRSEDGPPLVGSFQSFVTGGGGANIVTEKEQMSGNYGPQISWEIPLFQRIEAAAKGSRANIAAAEADARGAQATLAADVATAYVDYRAAQNRRLALIEAAQSAEQLATILETSAKAGITADADAADARRLAESVKARTPQAEIEIRRAYGVLALLRGRAPGVETEAMVAQLNLNGPVPSYPLRTAPLAPAELLRARPDLAAAEARALLAAADLGIARVDMLPRLSLTGTLGVADNLIGSGLPERLAQTEATASLTAPLFAFGKLRANVKVRESRFQQALINYRASVNQASAEASGALLALNQGDAVLTAARAAEAAAQRTANGVRASFGVGIASLADRLRADQQLIDARLIRLDAEATQARAAIGVYRAFGGAPALSGKSRA
ncbi:MAG: efflux transporter outer membrane subunit [Caulobacterales bacterium]|jgi:NodT family efflux transporter outer membrane factor (OMF) lipoprotein